MVIFDKFLSKSAIKLNDRIPKMTTVRSLKLLKLNRTPAFYIHQYGSKSRAEFGSEINKLPPRLLDTLE